MINILRNTNRIVPFKYFNQENKETIYALGPVEEREASDI